MRFPTLMIIAIGWVVFPSSSVMGSSLIVSKTEKPNILLILSDDHTTQGVGCYGSRLARLNPTPTIDALAEEGMVFTHAFCSNSICTPSRASLISGRYSHMTSTRDLDSTLEPKWHTLPRQFREAGYETAVIGKWHLTHEPLDFDHYCVLPGQGKYFDPSFLVRGEKNWPENRIHIRDKHSTDAITDLTLEWLKNRESNQPFFLMHQYKAPHDFFEYAPRYETYLENVTIPEPQSLWKIPPQYGSIATRGNDDELIPHIGTSVSRRNAFRNYTHMYADNETLSDQQATQKAYQIYVKKFLRCVKGVDDNVARLIAYLKESGQYENTLIIYSADQGFMLGEHDYIDKRWMLEESMRIPLIIHGPKFVAQDVRTEAIIENVDIAPTLLDFAGAPIPESIQGASFRRLCETGEEPEDWKSSAYYRYWMHIAHHDVPAHLGMRTKDYKIIFYYGIDFRDRNKPRTPPGWEVYDLKNDPLETRNLVSDPRHHDLVKRLKEQLRQTRIRVGDEGREFPQVEKVIQSFWDDDEEDRAKAKAISASYREYHLQKRRYIPGENKHDK